MDDLTMEERIRLASENFFAEREAECRYAHIPFVKEYIEDVLRQIEIDKYEYFDEEE